MHKKLGGKRCMAALLSASLVLSSTPVTMAEDDTNVTTEVEEIPQEMNDIPEVQDEVPEVQDEAIDNGAGEISVELPEEEEQVQIFDEESAPVDESTEQQAIVYSDTEKAEKATVTYTDGFSNIEYFKDEVYETEVGQKTPQFQGSTKRVGYDFVGWSPEVTETVTGNVTYVAQWKLQEKDMKVNQIFVGITKDEIPEDFALDWKVTTGSFTDYQGALEKKDATVTEADGKVTLTWTVKVPYSGGLDIIFTGKNYEVEGYEVETKYTNIHHVSTNFGASPQRVTNTYTKKAEKATVTYTDGFSNIEYFKDEVYETEVGQKTPQFQGSTKRVGYDFVGWSPEVTETVTGNVTYVAQWKLQEKDMKVNQIFVGITKDEIPEDFALDWKVTTGSFTDYQGTLEKKDATVTEADGKVTLTWTVKVPYSGGLDIIFTGKNYEVEGYEVETKYTNIHHVSTNFGASPQRVTNTYTKKAEKATVTYTDGFSNIEYFKDEVYETEVGQKTPQFQGSTKRIGYDFVGWSPEVTETVTGNVTYVAQWKLQEKDMKVNQIFDGITKDEIPEDFALDWKVTTGSFTDYQGTLEKKDATVTEAGGKVTLIWTVKVPYSGGLDIIFTGKNYEVEGYEVETKYTNIHHVSTNFGASPQRVTNTYTRKYSIEYYNEDGSKLLYTDVKKTNADTCNFSVYKGAEKKEGYELVGWAKHPYAVDTDTSYNLKKGPSLTKDQTSMKLYAVYVKNVKDEQVTINVHLEYIDSSLEDGYQVSKSYVPVTVNCLTPYEHKEKGAVHQVKYHDIIEALGGFEEFAVRKGYEIVGMAPNEGADETIFQLDNTFMQSGRENGGDFYLVAKKMYTLSYDGNAEGVAEIPEGAKSVSASGSASFTVTDKIPVRNGYTFIGWAVDKEGTTVYHSGETITVDGNEQNVTLYGIWEKIPEKEPESEKQTESEKEPESEKQTESEKPETEVKTNTALNLQASGENKAVSLKWTKIPEADGYEVYAAQCGKGDCKLVKTLENRTSVKWKQTGLKKATSYKYYVRAYATVNGKKVYLTKSNAVHVVTSGGKATNVKKIRIKKSNITLKKGKTQKLKLSVSYEKKNKKLLGHTTKYVYASSNSKVATVSKKGVVKAVGKGTCVITVRAENGVSATVKVTVK